VHTIHSALPSPELRPYVRAYAQREIDRDSDFVQPVVASLEQVLEFDLGAPPIIEYYGGATESAGAVSVVGAHSYSRASLRFRGRVQSFGVFLQPLGLWQLFGIPNSEMVNKAYQGTDLLGAEAGWLWHVIAEAKSFSARVEIVEAFLLKRAANAFALTPSMAAAAHIFRSCGRTRIAAIADRSGLSRRQFERKFLAELGMLPKHFARVTRFQMALDAKVASPDRSWLSIAHGIGYHDQMHMIREFQSLGLGSPTNVFAELGDGRPPALANSADHSESIHTSGLFGK